MPSLDRDKIASTLDFLEVKLSSSTTITSRKEIMNKFTELISKNLSAESFENIPIESLLSIWEKLIKFYDNMITKLITDIIKFKTQFVADNPFFEYKIEKILLNKTAITRFSDLLNYLNSLSKFFGLIVFRITESDDHQNNDLLNWILVHLIGEDYLIFYDFKETFYDIASGHADSFKFHFQNMLLTSLEVLNPNRDEYDKILESQYLILKETEESKYSSCYQISFSILYQVLPKNFIGKIYGTWEKILISCFIDFLKKYSVKKEDEHLFKVGFELLKLGFILDVSYKELSRAVVDLIIKASLYINCSEVLENYLLFLPATIEFEIKKKHDLYWLDDIYRLIKAMFVMVINNKILIEYKFEILEYPKNKNWIKLDDYEYMNSDKLSQILAKYIIVYYKLKPQNPEHLFNYNEENEDNADSYGNSYQYENFRMKKDMINYVLPALKSSNTVMHFVNKLQKGFTESNNSQRILLPLSFLYFSYDLPMPETNLLKLIERNENINFGDKLLFFLGLIKNNPTALKKEASSLFYSLASQALNMTVHKKYDDISNYFIYTMIFTNKLYGNSNDIQVINKKVLEILVKINDLGPVQNNLSTFKFWQGLCCFQPIFDNNLCISTFDHIIENWLCKLQGQESYLSMTNFIHWGFSEESSPLIKSKVSLDDNIDILERDLDMKIDLKKVQHLDYIRFKSLDQKWNKGCFRNMTSIINISNWLETQMPLIKTQIVVLRLIFFIINEVDVNTLIDIGFHGVELYFTQPIYNGEPVEYFRNLICVYDLFSVYEKMRDFKCIRFFFEKALSSVNHIVAFNFNLMTPEFFYIKDILKPFDTVFPFENKCRFLVNLYLNLFEFMKFHNYSYYSTIVNVILNEISLEEENEKAALVNSIIFAIKEQINTEVIHNVDTININCLLLGKILSSPVLMESQSKNKIIKLWFSLFSMTNPYTQPYALNSIKMLIKRLDITSQTNLFEKIINKIIQVQTLDSQYELFYKLAKISTHFLKKTLKQLVRIASKDRYLHMTLLLKKLCSYYKKNTISELIEFAGVDFMSFLWSGYYDAERSSIFIASIYEQKDISDNNYRLILSDKVNKLNFVAVVLASTNDFSKLKYFKIKDLMYSEQAKAQVLIRGDFDFAFQRVTELKINHSVKANNEVKYYIYLAQELDCLFVGILLNIVNILCTVLGECKAELIQHIMFEENVCSIYEGCGISVDQLQLVNDFKQYDQSSLIIEGNLLRLFSILENKNLNLDFSILILRKIKVLYLIVQNFSKNSTFIQNINKSVLKWMLDLPNFVTQFGRFRNFLFSILNVTNDICLTLKTELLIKLILTGEPLNDQEISALNKVFLLKGKLSYLQAFALQVLGFDDEIEDKVKTVELNHKEFEPEILLKLFKLSAILYDLILKKGYESLEINKIFNFKISKQFIAMLDWSELNEQIKVFLLTQIDAENNTTDNLLIAKEVSSFEKLVINLQLKYLTSHSYGIQLELKLFFCYLKTLLKEPLNNNIEPSILSAFSNNTIFIKSGVFLNDIKHILDIGKAYAMTEQNFQPNDTYMKTIYLLWCKLTASFEESSIWKILGMIEITYKNFDVVEDAICLCFAEFLKSKQYEIIMSMSWFQELIEAVNDSNFDSEKKKLILIKMFLQLRTLYYKEIHEEQVRLLYPCFNIDIFFNFALSLGFNELAFMLFEEQKNYSVNTNTLMPMLQKLDDSFIATSIPRSLDLMGYINESKYYANDDRFYNSNIVFNSASLDLSFENTGSLLNLANTFWHSQNYRIANSLTEDIFNNCLFDSYDEIISWNLPIVQDTLSNSNDTNLSFFNFFKNELIIGKSKKEKSRLKKLSLITSLFKTLNSTILTKSNGFSDSNLEFLSDKKVINIKNIYDLLDYPNRLIQLLEKVKFQGSYNIYESLDILFEVEKKYGQNAARNVLSFIVANKSNCVIKDVIVERNTGDTLYFSDIIHKKAALQTDFCNLFLLDFKFNYEIGNATNCVKAMIKLHQIVDNHKNNDHLDLNYWRNVSKFVDAHCRWITGDKQSSWKLLTILEEEIKNCFYLKTPLAIVKCLWSLESKRSSRQDVWNDFYNLFANDENLKTGFSFKKEINKLSSYYHTLITERFLEIHDFTELSHLIGTHSDLNGKCKILKDKIEENNNNTIAKNKLKQSFIILTDNLKFVNNRYVEILRIINEQRRDTVFMACEFLELLSIEITKDSLMIYDEAIDKFFSIWFGIIKYLSNGMFDGDASMHNLIEKIQQEKNYYFKAIYKYESFEEKYIRTKESVDRNFLNRCFLISWNDCLKKWKQAMDLILEKHPLSVLPWLSTIYSKLKTGDINIFERYLENSLADIILKCLEKYPTITILQGLSYRNYSNDNNLIAKERSDLILLLFDSMCAKNKEIDFLIKSYLQFSEFNQVLANSKAANNLSEVLLRKDKVCQSIFKKNSDEVLNIFNSNYKLLLPIVNFMDNKLYENKKALEQYYISSINNTIEISTTGISKPRITSFVLQNGLSYKVLIKGSDDLRTDYIMLSVMKKINKLIFRDMNYTIATYEVFPMGHNFGMLEFKKDCTSLSNILRPLHEKDEISFTNCRKQMDNAYRLKKSNKERIQVFENIQKQVKPRFGEFFKKNFSIPEMWYNAKKKYVSSLAVTSIIGYILGIGDRHMSNILVNCDTGELVHIDFGITFDAGKHLRIPELVPFRFTKDISDALGIYQDYHTVDRFFEDVYKKVRVDKSMVMLFLENLKLDPLYKWSLNADEMYFKNNGFLEEFTEPNISSVYGNSEIPDSPIFTKKQKLAIDNKYKGLSIVHIKKKIKAGDSIAEQHSAKCLSVVLDKLQGGSERQSTESVVQMLLRDAQSSNNLGIIFYGWAPFY
ncbi:hypothetical protein QEN19_003298 [Hanseniaspora menglaensis]